MNLAVYQKVNADLDVMSDENPEVRQRWLPMGIYLNDPDAFTNAEAWVSSMGRNKYLDPVYQALEQTNNHDMGVQWLCENIDFYHPVSITSILGDLGLAADTDTDELCSSNNLVVRE